MNRTRGSRGRLGAWSRQINIDRVIGPSAGAPAGISKARHTRCRSAAAILPPWCLDQHHVDDAEHLPGFGVVNRTAAAAWIRGRIQLEDTERAQRQAPDDLRIEVGRSPLRNGDRRDRGDHAAMRRRERTEIAPIGKPVKKMLCPSLTCSESPSRNAGSGGPLTFNSARSVPGFRRPPPSPPGTRQVRHRVAESGCRASPCDW